MYAMTEAVMTMLAATSTNAVRMYVRTVREGRQVSQKELAKQIGLSERAYTEWESGRTDEIKAGPLMRAVMFLRASEQHIRELIEVNANEERGRELAESLLTAKQRAEIDKIISETPPEIIDAVLAEMRAEIERNPPLLTYLQGILSGLRAPGSGS